jgi:hypothetical protein
VSILIVFHPDFIISLHFVCNGLFKTNIVTGILGVNEKTTGTFELQAASKCFPALMANMKTEK